MGVGHQVIRLPHITLSWPSLGVYSSLKSEWLGVDHQIIRLPRSWTRFDTVYSSRWRLVGCWSTRQLVWVCTAPLLLWSWPWLAYLLKRPRDDEFNLEIISFDLSIISSPGRDLLSYPGYPLIDHIIITLYSWMQSNIHSYVVCVHLWQTHTNIKSLIFALVQVLVFYTSVDVGEEIEHAEPAHFQLRK